jgi:chromate transporter
MDVFAIAESTPGAVAVNVATFVGTKKAGIFGGVFTTFGLMLPSIVIIMTLSYVINIFRDNLWVGYVFKGIRAGVLVLIAKAVISFFRNMRKDWFDFVLLIGAFLVAFLTDVGVIYIILVTIVLCIILMVVKNIYAKKKGKITAENKGEDAISDESAAEEISADEQAVTEDTTSTDAGAVSDNDSQAHLDETAEKEDDK